MKQNNTEQKPLPTPLQDKGNGQWYSHNKNTYSLMAIGHGPFMKGYMAAESEYKPQYDQLKADNQKKEDTNKELLELVKWISKVTNSPEIGIRCDKAIAKHNQ